MKKFFVTMLLACGLMAAQNASAQLKFGLQAGMNVSKMSFDKVPDMSSDNRAGWYLGPKVEFKVPVVGVGFDAAVHYAQRELKGNVESTDAATSKTLRSIEVPINLRYNFGISLASVFVATGPQFGFNLGNKGWALPNTTDFQLKKSSFSWNIGAGVQLINHLEVGIGYNIALSKYAKLTGVGTNADASFKSNSWQIQVAYLF
ncbi:MAG: PorT family protein [Bacteroidaceae bacterium]|nr:PorT family protein [Bacteroidaceae bacterium]